MRSTFAPILLLLSSLLLGGCAQQSAPAPSASGASTAQGGLRFAQPRAYGSFQGTPFVADLDADGDLDMVVQRRNGENDFPILRNAGDGSFAIEGTPDGMEIRLVADLNGDGRADLIGRDSALDELVVDLARADGSYAQAVSSLPFDVRDPADFTIADVDGDGHPDVVVGVATGTYALHLDGSGKIVSTQTVSSSALSVAPDLDGDGHADFYQWQGASLSITSSKTQTSWTTSLPDCDIGAVRFADLDQDGVLDVVVAGYDRTTGDLHGFSMKGAGTATFAAQTDTDFGGLGFDDVVDIDGDGRVDIALRGSDGQTESFALGNGAFGFGTAAVAVTFDEAPLNVQFADLNGDGRGDVIAKGQYTIYVVLSM